MITRELTIIDNRSFFLFGARGTGKTSLLKAKFSEDESLYIDLLNPDEVELFTVQPNELVKRINNLGQKKKWVIIDEIQKIPKLLDIVHQQIESTKFLFALTGSSARKLKRGGANLLAGRAFLNNLYPLTFKELGNKFNLDQTLEWGSLPDVILNTDFEFRHSYLTTYTQTYLKEEIAQEQVLRKLDPFRKFLPIAAQSSGQIVNFTKLGKEAGTSHSSVMSYFQILEDTLMGTLLDPFHFSIRKRQRQNPKFYFFDTGVMRSLARLLTVSLKPQTYAYGVAFEHFIINEIHRLQSYGRKDYQLSYLRTKDDAEIDLIIERPGLPLVLIEIKSTNRVTDSDTRSLSKFYKDFDKCEAYCFSQDPHEKKIDNVVCLPWQKGFTEIGL